MARVENPRKQFNFQVVIPGLNPFLCQQVKAPDSEFDSTEHGDTNFLVKTAGLKKVGILNIVKICPADGIDLYFELWQRQIGSTVLGGGQLPSVYKRPIIITEYSTDGITPLRTRIYKGCWPKKINGKDYSRTGSDNTVENIDFEVDQDDIP